MMLTAAFAGIIGMLLAGEGRVRSVTFMPDRDAMTDAYGGIMLSTFATNAWAFSLRKRYPPFQPIIATAGIVAPGQSPWFDPIVRVPDFLAGALAGVKFQGGTEFARPERDEPLLRTVLADNRNIVIVGYPELTRQSIRSHRLLFSRTPFVSNQ